MRAATGSAAAPARWLYDLLGVRPPAEGEEVCVGGSRLVLRDGILRAVANVSVAQRQTSDAFGYKWAQRDTYTSAHALSLTCKWLTERYGDPAGMDWLRSGGAVKPLMLDAGCGAGLSALALFGDRLNRVRYVGIDMSTAIEIAAARFRERGISGAFLQCDLSEPPFPDGSFDVVLSEGVMHHTDSTERALHRLARLLRDGGTFLFYVYRRKGPIREFVDDHIRAKLQDMAPEDAWAALMPLTKLGKQLGELGITLDIEEPIDLLEIPAGKIDLQRLFYWHIFKAYYRPDLTLDEMHHINFDWYAPRNAFRQTPEEVRAWCRDAGLAIERERVEESGITIVARKQGRG